MVEIVEKLDTNAIEGAYRGGGSAPYGPKMMLTLLFYCYAKGIEPYITSGRHAHNRSLEERLAPPPSPPQNSDAVAAMKHRLKTEAGKQFYAKRQSTASACIRDY